MYPLVMWLFQGFSDVKMIENDTFSTVFLQKDLQEPEESVMVFVSSSSSTVRTLHGKAGSPGWICDW